jgi:HK97 family phage major capsid protein
MKTINIDKKMGHDPDKEFENIGEFFCAIARTKQGDFDPRLKACKEKREQVMGAGAKGGYAIPEQFDPTLLQVSPQASIVRPRAAVIPAGSPPDAKLNLVTLDQTSGQNIYGGVSVVHTGETLTLTETDANLRKVVLEPKKMAAYTVASNELINNWSAASAFIPAQLRAAMAGQEDYDFMRGSGVNMAMGFINSAAAISYTRATANSVAWADVYNMFARVKMGGPLVWLASQTIIPQLAAMVDSGSHAVWISGTGVGTGAAQSLPSTLMGIPLVFVDRLPALGTKGDLCLVNLSYYLIKDGSGPFVDLSDQIRFLNDEVVFRITWHVDGKPWLTEPIGLEGSTANTVSPFVVLAG